MKKILLATDLTAYSDRAMERALKLAQEQDAKLHIIHVLPAYKAKALQSSLAKDTEDLIKSYFYENEDSHDLDITIKIVTSGEPSYAAIADYAHTMKIDLIVMGMHGKENFADLFTGTTIERLTRTSLKPILVIKNKSTGPYQSIVSAVDYSPASRNALRTAMELSPLGVFEIIHAYTMPSVYPVMADYAIETFSQTEKRQEHAMTDFINTERAHFEKEHNGTSKRLAHKIVEGSPYKTLVKEAENCKADLITIGAHGSCFLMLTKLGGMAESILSNPPCDVLLVKE